MTCFTPGSEAAYLEAASRWASVSTLPERVTVPFAACTLICLFCKPESAPSFDCTSAVTCASLGVFVQANVNSNSETSRATRANDDDFAFMELTPGKMCGYLSV